MKCIWNEYGIVWALPYRIAISAVIYVLFKQSYEINFLLLNWVYLLGEMWTILRKYYFYYKIFSVSIKRTFFWKLFQCSLNLWMIFFKCYFSARTANVWEKKEVLFIAFVLQLCGVQDFRNYTLEKLRLLFNKTWFTIGIKILPVLLLSSISQATRMKKSVYYRDMVT